MRIAGLPARTILDTRSEAISELFSDVERARELARSTHANLLSECYRLVGVAGGRRRGALLSVSRRLRRASQPRSGDMDRLLMEPLSLSTAYEAWTAACSELQTVTGRFAAKVDEVSIRSGRGLVRLFADHTQLRLTLEVASPSLAASCADAIKTGVLRKSVVDSLTRYVARAATKTSPFGGFLLTSELVMRPSVTTDVAPRWRLDLSTPYLEHALKAAVLAEFAESDLTRFTLNPSATATSERLIWIDTVNGEALRSLKTSLVTEGLYRVAAREPLTREQLSTCASQFMTQLSATATGMPDPARVVASLINDGLLVAHTADESISGLAQAADELGLAECSRDLRDIAEALDSDLDPADADGAANAQAGISNACVRISRRGASLSAVSALSTLVDRGLPPQLGYLYSASEVDRNVADTVKMALPQLTAIARLSSLVDPYARLRSTVSQAFVHSYGVSGHVAFMEFYAWLIGALPHLDSAAGAASVDEWDYTRQHSDLGRESFLVDMGRFVRSCHESDEIDLSESVASLCGGQMNNNYRANTVGIEFQLVDQPDQAALVLNRVTPGNGRLRRRLDFFRRHSVMDPLTDQSQIEIVAELRAPGYYSLSHRVRGAPFEIVHGHGVQARKDHEIPLRDLEVGLCPSGQRLSLTSRRHGRPIALLNADQTALIHLPAVARTLLALWGNQFALSPSAWFEPVRTVQGGEAEGVSRVPPLRAGPLMLAREEFHVGASSLPDFGPAGSDAAWTLQLFDWLRLNELPERGFVTSVDAHGNGKWKKPQYYDVLAPLLVRSFVRTARRESVASLKIVPCVPDPVRLDDPSRALTQRHVEEYCVDVGFDG